MRLYLRVICEVCLCGLLPDKLGIPIFHPRISYSSFLSTFPGNGDVLVASVCKEVCQPQIATVAQTFVTLFVLSVFLSFGLSSQLRAPSSLALPSRGERAEMGKGLEDNLRESGKPLYRSSMSVFLCLALAFSFL